MLYPVRQIIDNMPTFDKPIESILAGLKTGGALQVLDAEEYITEQQRRWVKGVLLPALAKDTGDSKEYWETKLKLAVMPDRFKPFYIPMGKQVFPVIPSITILSKNQMGEFIEGSVAKCHEWGILWVTLPDKELRKK